MSKIKTFRILLMAAVLFGVILAPVSAWACDAAGPNTHIGKVMSVDATKMTFTIRDAQTRSPITFIAKDTSIIDGLKGINGMITVNYEEEGDDLTAVGVTF